MISSACAIAIERYSQNRFWLHLSLDVARCSDSTSLHLAMYYIYIYMSIAKSIRLSTFIGLDLSTHSRVVEVCFTPLHLVCIVLGDVRFGCSWSTMETCFIKLSVLELIWRAHEVWRSLATDYEEYWWCLHTMQLSVHWPCSMILCGLPIFVWVAFIPSYFHFVVIPPTVHSRMFACKNISRLD